MFSLPLAPSESLLRIFPPNSPSRPHCIYTHHHHHHHCFNFDPKIQSKIWVLFSRPTSIMGSLPPELTFDFTPNFVPKTLLDFFKDVSMIGNLPDRLSKLNDFVKSLEDEMRKIDAFKRELPLCMLLLKDAILAVKEESMQCVVPKKTQPVLEEFIPLKKERDHEEEEEDHFRKGNDYRDQKNWMSSVQLWNSADNYIFDRKRDSKFETKRNEKGGPVVTQVSLQSYRSKIEERIHLPFKPYSSVRKEEFPIHGLSLCTPGIKNPIEESASSGSRSSGTRAVSSSTLTAPVILRNGMQQQQQSSRKQRRCWSQELHRRFESALQQLGGSQVATPKQIRELMQVDGLTNDEVKSHLQKYRLHTRRLPASTVAPANQSVVVLGGLLVPQDQYGDSSKACSSQSGSPQGPLQLAGRGGTSTTGGDSMEDDDDVKSESYSWKSRSRRPGNEDA